MFGVVPPGLLRCSSGSRSRALSVLQARRNQSDRFPHQPGSFHPASRECLSCERRFTTYERIEESPIRVIKKDGTRVPFDREKIRFGVEKACYKRPVSPEQIDALVGTVEATVYEDGEREVSSRRIGELVFNALRELDKVAFVRFASVYREFQDVNDFVEELQPILDGRRRDTLH